MFADDANLFLTHKDVRYLFETANLQLNVTLSLNISKTTYSFLHKPSKMEDVPLLLPNSKIKNICWKEHSKYIESKFAKNIWLVYKARRYALTRFCHCIILTCIPILTTEVFHR